MINSLIKTQQELKIISGLPEVQEDCQIIWLDINAPTVEEAALLLSRFGIDIASQHSNIIETDCLLYMRTNLLMRDQQATPHFGQVTFILGDQWVATLSQQADFHPFNHVISRLRKKPAAPAIQERYCVSCFRRPTMLPIAVLIRLPMHLNACPIISLKFQKATASMAVNWAYRTCLRLCAA